VGYFLGHGHGGRQFAPNVHSAFAPTLGFMLFAQIVLGTYLKLHLEKGVLGRTRRYFVFAHGLLGKLMPVMSWVQMLFGGITAMGYCRDDHLGQCLAHFIMGSAFIGYGVVLTTLLLVGQMWLRRTGRSQEFFDSLIIALWGMVNTFTEHRWGTAWVKNDIQHTSMGVVWWCAGLLGMWLSRRRDGRPKRNLIPAMVIFMTGWAMGGHPQELELSTHVHTTFGYTLMAAGAARGVEISFILKDRASVSRRATEETSSFQFMTPYVSLLFTTKRSLANQLTQLLVASGFLFMGATEEQLSFLSGMEVTHVSYILLLYSVAFLLFLFVNVLLHIYAQYTWPIEKAITLPKHRRPVGPNGHALNGRARGGSGPADDPESPPSRLERERLRDASEFELEALMSEGESSAGTGRRKESESVREALIWGGHNSAGDH
jgi:Protein of unknown function (Ytp1)